jgi:uncharacterized protein (DUF1697 family)
MGAPGEAWRAPLYRHPASGICGRCTGDARILRGVSRYIALLRGINVGGKNRVPMADLRAVLEGLGFRHVATYIASGNVVLDAEPGAEDVAALIEDALPRHFDLDDGRVRVLVIPQAKLQAIVDNRPEGFGAEPGRFHSDVIFLLGLDAADALAVFSPREGVDTVWAGNGVVYSQRLSAERTRSRLSKVMGTPAYASMTIRNWNTTTALLAIAAAGDAGPVD